MRRSNWMLLLIVLVAVIGKGPRAQEPSPKEAFKAVHLVTLTSADVAPFAGSACGSECGRRRGWSA